MGIEKLWWLGIFAVLYWAFCLFGGARGAVRVHSAGDYFISGRRLSMWVFVLATTAASFSGWTFIQHPGRVFSGGFPFAYASLFAIAIPFTGVMFLRRQWMLGKRFGYVTPGEMFADYFQGPMIRLLSVIVALFFSVPFLAIQLKASGMLFNFLSDGKIGAVLAMWVLSAVVCMYVVSGGLRSVAHVGALQSLLIVVGIAGLGLIALSAVGGWNQLNDLIFQLTLGDPVRTEAGYSHYVAIPGVIQWVGTASNAVGGPWTGMMILTTMFAMMGIQTAPAFTMWAFSSRDPRPFARQQVWASALVIGFILLFFTTIQGMAGHFLGGNQAMASAGIAIGNRLGFDSWGDGGLGQGGSLVHLLMRMVSGVSPWLTGFLAICALAAMQSTGAAYMATGAGILTRDLYKPFLNPRANHRRQVLIGRLGTALIAGSALLAGTFLGDGLALWGGLAVSFGLQLSPALIAICWWPYLTRQGVSWGLLAGLVTVIFTGAPAPEIFQFMGIELWGRHPLTLHAAGWGIAFNLALAIGISAITQDAGEGAHRITYHKFLREHASLPVRKRKLVPVAWIAALLWFFFAVGPGAVIGNWIFGDPNDSATWWVFGMPSIWAWQALWWLLGVGMMWLLAYGMELSVRPSKEVVPLVDDIWESPGAMR